MIKKIVAIRNVGRLEKCNAIGDLTFRKLTLIFAENSRGKTTLTDILRSLSTGKGEHILGRKTLGSTVAPSAIILIDNDKAVNFRDGAWDGVGPKLAIYDSTFIHENVCAGDRIDHEQKKNLYRVIVGEEGVTLARKVDEYDVAIRDANRDVAAKAAVVRASLPAGMKLEVFLALKPDLKVGEKIDAKQLEIAALEKAKEIKEKASLASISLPQLHDREGLCAAQEAEVRRRLGSLGIAEVLTAPRSPWQNAYVERFIGSIRTRVPEPLQCSERQSFKGDVGRVLSLLPSISTSSGAGQAMPD
jgi:wobble nucleotide-excising tRNase